VLARLSDGQVIPTFFLTFFWDSQVEVENTTTIKKKKTVRETARHAGQNVKTKLRHSAAA
jgi:hypothetical protein